MDDLLPWLRARIEAARQRGLAIEHAPDNQRLNPGVVPMTAREIYAQCEAHTAILAIHNVWEVVYPDDIGGGEPADRRCIGCGYDALENARTPDVNNCPTLRAVALAYQHHSGYREEWRP